MSSDGARYLEQVIKQRDELQRTVERQAELIASALASEARLTAELQELRKTIQWQQRMLRVPRARQIVLMLAQRKRQARRDVRRARALGDHKAAPFLRTTYESTYCEASNAHELARRILRGIQT